MKRSTKAILKLITHISELSDTEQPTALCKSLLQESVDKYFEMRNADPEGTSTPMGDTEVRLALLKLHPYSEEVLALFHQQRAESVAENLNKLSDINGKIDLILSTHPAHGAWKGPR
jgi:hypothetical protein